MVVYMLVYKISPQGYCNGVKNAIKITSDSLNDDSIEKPIYLLGMLIHNKYVCNELEKKGVVILNSKSKLDDLEKIKHGSVIITAHGVEKKIKDIILDKGLNLIDATCPIVSNIHSKLLEHIEKGYEIIYIGKGTHPETIGVLNESDKIHLIENISDIEQIPNDRKYYVTNQTTLPIDTINLFHEKIKEKIDNIIIDNNVCLATTKRENALYDIKCDLLVIVGDKISSNCNKLFDVAKRKSLAKQVIFIENAKDLINFDLLDCNTAYVTSGASTPPEITDQVIRFLESDMKDLTILDEKLILI